MRLLRRAIILRQITPTPLQQVLGMSSEFVDAVDATVPSHDGVVQEAVPCFHTPEQLAAVAIKHRESRAGGEILDGRGGAAFRGSGLQAEVREVIATDQQIIQHTDEVVPMPRKPQR